MQGVHQARQTFAGDRETAADGIGDGTGARRWLLHRRRCLLAGQRLGSALARVVARFVGRVVARFVARTLGVRLGALRGVSIAFGGSGALGSIAALARDLGFR
jgi:hypothetical protein